MPTVPNPLESKLIFPANAKIKRWQQLQCLHEHVLSPIPSVAKVQGKENRDTVSVFILLSQFEIGKDVGSYDRSLFPDSI